MTRSIGRRRVAGVMLAAAVLASAAYSGLGPAGAASASPGAGVILQEGAAGAVKDSYIVVLKSGTPEAGRVASTAGALTKRYGGVVKRSYTSAVKGFSVRMSATAARSLARHPAVAYVEQDRVVTLKNTQTNPTWGLDRVDQRDLPLSKSYSSGSAAGVTAYILDTGIRTSHADFGGRARDGWDFIDNDAVANDCQGHGTHVAGTVGGSTYGVAKNVNLVGVRVLNCSGSGSYSQIIAGVDWVTKNAVHPAVANMSLGGSASTALDDAVKRSIAAGVTYVLAAGNDNRDACQQSPARTPAAITVGATGSSDARASFSNFGTCLDIFAPGVSILSAASSGNTATTTMSGTSMAAPHVAGAAALVLGVHPAATPAQVRDQLVAQATAGKVTGAGTGSPNRLLFTGAINTAPAPTPTASPTPTTNPTPTPTASTPAPAPTSPAPTSPAPTSPAPTSPAPTTPAPTTPAACGPFTAGTDVPIRDLAIVYSPVTVTKCTGNASRTTTVDVDIKHSARGSLIIHLVAPNGLLYPLKATATNDRTPNLKATYVVNASGVARNGTWKLRVWDVYRGDIGYVDSWTLRP